MTRPAVVDLCSGTGSRGCGCPFHAARRIINREYARRQRATKLDAARASRKTCPKQHGSGVCGGVLETTIVDGRMAVVCPLCERQRQGICRDCPRPVEGCNRALRCAEHKEIARLAQVRASQDRHRKQRNAHARASYQQDPEVRRRRNEYKRLYRQAHPDKVRAQKRRHAMRQTERYLDYHRRYNAQQSRAQRKREQAKASYYREHPTRPAPTCQHCQKPIPWIPLPGGKQGRPPLNCDRCCSKAELKRRLKLRAAHAATATAVATPPAASPRTTKADTYKPLRVKQPMPARYAPSGERLCVTPECDTVVTHRRKKCSRCRAKQVELAQQRLEAHHGRGRRVDLGAPAPRQKHKPGPRPTVAETPVVAARPHGKKPSRGIKWNPWTDRVDRGMTTWEMAEEIGTLESTVRSRLRLAGGDLLSRAYANNARAERTKRNISAATKWAKPPMPPTTGDSSARDTNTADSRVEVQVGNDEHDNGRQSSRSVDRSVLSASTRRAPIASRSVSKEVA